MSSFDSISDAAAALRTEGQEIDLVFKKGFPVTGKGTVEWNIPQPAAGCTSGSPGAYAGIIILLRTESLDATNIPQDGTIYVPDPTADFDISTADKIGDALVVGAFYECEKKARDEDLTISFEICDLKPDVSYYIAGYALDCQNRYHADGIRSYSDAYGDKETNIPASQIINLGVNGTGVLPTDGTGLVAGNNYEFDIIIDDTYPEGSNVKTVEVTMDGIDAGTYQDLIDNTNKQILLVDNPPQSPQPPNTNSLWWAAKEQQLFQWDGMQYIALDSLVEPTDPATPGVGSPAGVASYWYDTKNKELNIYTASPTWTVTKHYEIENDLNDPNCELYWFDTTSPMTARQWNGSIWCDLTTIISDTDPSDCPVIECGTYWYDEVNSELFERSDVNNQWQSTTAIFWHEAPNALETGTYWFDDITNKMFIRVGSPPTAWGDITDTVIIQETEPTDPIALIDPPILVDGILWYNPSTEELQQYSANSPAGFSPVPVLVWPEDPTNIESCDLWWNSVTDVLFTWDNSSNNYIPVKKFIQSLTDPSESPVFTVETVWYDSINDIMYRWDGSAWILVEHVNSITDPLLSLVVDDAWYKPSTNEWNIWDGSQWNSINPIDSVIAPPSFLPGTYWYNTKDDSLQTWNGSTWVTTTFSTVAYSPPRNSEWYNSSNGILYTWDGTKWVEAIPIAKVSFNSRGGLIFTTTGTGSNNVVIVPAPNGAVSSTSPCSFGTGYAYHGVNDIAYSECEYYDNNIQKVYQARAIPPEIFLWNHINPTPNIVRPHTGNDGKSGLPSYAELGVGDDGTPDERRELMDSIRRQLGYPVVEVELTNYQIDTCIQGALESFRKRSSASVRRGFFFLDIEAGKQQYLLSNKVLGYNKIVNIMAAYRFTSAFLSSAHGSGVYGQIVLQHLYNMGTYDLTSFHLVSQYVEQLEMLFATRLTFGWHEHDRILAFYSSFTRPERVLLDCMVERTEQDLLTDRYIKTWLERYALAESMMILSHIRGKYASLPGAGGGISLNAGELISIAQSYRDELLQQVDDFVVDTPEDVGLHSTVVLG